METIGLFLGQARKGFPCRRMHSKAGFWFTWAASGVVGHKAPQVLGTCLFMPCVWKRAMYFCRDLRPPVVMWDWLSKKPLNVCLLDSTIHTGLILRCPWQGTVKESSQQNQAMKCQCAIFKVILLVPSFTRCRVNHLCSTSLKINRLDSHKRCAF